MDVAFIQQITFHYTVDHQFLNIVCFKVFIFITNTDFDPPKRLIILSHENKSHPNQLSTASVFMQQIPTNYQFDSEISITTPLSIKVFRHHQQALNIEDSESHPQKLELKSYRNVHNEPGFLPIHNIHPNHRYDVRRQAEEIHQPRPFEYIIRGTPPTAFQRTHKNSSSFPQIPKEYVGTVNSIQDILRQVNDEGNSQQESNGMQKIKIAGTYKHRKVDDITSMFESAPRKNRGHVIDEPAIQPLSVNTNNVIRDPFYKYKPSSLSDVNLMATNQFRFAPYHILSNKYVPMASSHTPHSMDPSNLYHQIIMANKNRLKYSDDNSKNDNIQSKQKPFTLMLDVYPMPDDEHISSNVPLPVKYQNHFNPNMMRHPGIGSINILPPFFNNAHYPQLKPNRYPNLPHYNNHNYFRKFGTKPLNSGSYTSNDRESNNNNPSQITVHLNLFPKKKERSDNQNTKILNRNEPNVPDKDGPNTFSTRLHERMAKLGDKVNQTENQNDLNNEEPKNLGKITNKVDMDMFQNKTVSNVVKHNVLMIDENSEDRDSSEDIFSKEFLQFQSPTEFATDSTTFESKSVDSSSQFNVIPTILPIEPRGYSHQLDKSLFKTKLVVSTTDPIFE